MDASMFRILLSKAGSELCITARSPFDMSTGTAEGSATSAETCIRNSQFLEFSLIASMGKIQIFPTFFFHEEKKKYRPVTILENQMSARNFQKNKNKLLE